MISALACLPPMRAHRWPTTPPMARGKSPARSSTSRPCSSSGYVVSSLNDLGISVPAAYAGAPLAYDAAHGAWQITGTILNVPAMLVVAGVTALAVIGIHEAARVNNVIVAIKLPIVLLFIVAAASHFSTGNWVTAGNPEGHFIPPNAGFGDFGWSGVVRGAAVVFFAYIGFDAVSTTAQEAI